jgi:iron complex transport system permease protein
VLPVLAAGKAHRVWIAVIAAVSVLIVASSLFVGHGDLGNRELAATFVELRATRAAAAFLAGAALAVAGVVLQTLFRNPLVDPAILGTTSGASLGGQLAILALHAAPAWLRPEFVVPEMVLPLGCLAGALVALLILLAVIRQTRSELAVLLAGFLLSSLFVSVGALIVSLAQNSWELGRAVIAFTLGGVGSAGTRHVLVGFPLVLAAVLALWAWCRPLEVLLSGEDEARTLGVDVRRVRWWTVVWVAVGTSAAVAIGGNVGFVGLVVPHVLRPLVGIAPRRLVPVSALAGGAFVVLCDMVVRAAPVTGELPLGVITGLVGGPLFLVLVVRSQREVSRA